MNYEQQDIVQGHGEDRPPMRVWEQRAYLVVRAQTREEAIDIISLAVDAADKFEVMLSMDESPPIDVTEDYE